MNTKIGVLGIATALMVTTLAAPAVAGVTYTAPVLLSGSNGDNFGFGGSERFEFEMPQYDGGKGRVKGVSLTLDITHSAILGGLNNDADEYTFETSADGYVTLVIPFLDAMMSSGSPPVRTVLQPGVPASADGSYHHQITLSLDRSDAGFLEFLGKGAIPFGIEVGDDNWWDRERTNIADFRYDWSFSGLLSLSYMYASDLRSANSAAAPAITDVPEPAMIGLLGLGFMGLAYRRRTSPNS